MSERPEPTGPKQRSDGPYEDEAFDHEALATRYVRGSEPAGDGTDTDTLTDTGTQTGTGRRRDGRRGGRRRGTSRNAHLLRTYLHRKSPWDRLLRLMALALVVLGVIHGIHANSLDNRMTQAIRVVSGNPDLDVHCRRYLEVLTNFRSSPGYVEWGSNTAELQLDVCSHAADFAENPTYPQNRVALQILTHELAHLVGHVNESQTECVAMWALPDTAVAIGASRAEGQVAAQWYATNHNVLPRADYQAPGCLSGSPPSSPLLR